jgi:hypothetical protein
MKAEAGARWFLRSLIAAIIVSMAWVDGAVAVAVEAFALPNALPPNDDGSSAAVPIGFPINFFGVTHTELFVNNNGNVTFGAPLSTFTPFGLVGTRQPIIAPFFADVDTRAPGSGIVRFGTPAGRPDLFVVDWVIVGYFREHDDKLNSFQLILQDLSAVPTSSPETFASFSTTTGSSGRRGMRVAGPMVLAAARPASASRTAAGSRGPSSSFWAPGRMGRF